MCAMFSHASGPLLVLLQPGPLSCVRSIKTEKQRYIFLSRGLQQLFFLTKGDLERREREERECGFQTVSMSPLTVSVPQLFTMEAIVCLGEKAWVFCFNHFWKSNV